MFSEATATTPAWKGSAATLGSVPWATKDSRTIGACAEVAAAGVGIRPKVGAAVAAAGVAATADTTGAASNTGSFDGVASG